MNMKESNNGANIPGEVIPEPGLEDRISKNIEILNELDVILTEIEIRLNGNMGSTSEQNPKCEPCGVIAKIIENNDKTMTCKRLAKNILRLL